MAPLLRGKRLADDEVSKAPSVDGRDEVVLELIPGIRSTNKGAEEIR
jgi:hypothetical protein